MATISVTPGSRFGQLTAVEEAPRDKWGGKQWLFRCDCGRDAVIRINSIQRGVSTRCGRGECRRGGCRTHKVEYKIWGGMLIRCLNPDARDFKNYGGRGITVCERWQNSFAAFYSDMGSRPSPDYSIERRDNNKGYSPENCYWATRTEQARNKRNTRFIEYQGRRMPLTEAADLAGVHEMTVRSRLLKGWDENAALTAPVKSKAPSSARRKNYYVRQAC